MARSSEQPAETKIDRGEEYVDFAIPFTGDTKPELIGVNGEFIRVMPGETVSVKRKFVEAWQNAKSQEQAALRAQVRAQNAGKKALADL